MMRSAQRPKKHVRSSAVVENGPLATLPDEIISLVLTAVDLKTAFEARRACKPWGRPPVPWPALRAPLDDRSMELFVGACVPELVKRAAKLDYLTPTGLALLARLPKLEDLDLNSTSLANAADLAFLDGMRNLKSLDLSNCANLTHAGLAHVANTLWWLKGLSLAHCSCVTDAGLAQLATLQGLTKLNLHGCSSMTNAGLVPLKSLPLLKELFLSCFPLTNDGCGLVAELTGLTLLSLTNFPWITNSGFDRIRALQGLTSLEIGNCYQLTNASMSTVAAFPKLSKLDLNRLPICDDGLKSLHGLPLKQFSFWMCPNITGFGIQNLVVACRIESLNPSYNLSITSTQLLGILPSMPSVRELVLVDWDWFEADIQAQFKSLPLTITTKR